ncbi:Cache 3/Cache 2 fusion domain-containing protein [Oxalobacteraceae bacterium R-40]|uniref:Cache 3/Cache 2 fusion domain-containing protein n=1 Tax=Keguizhuia sedimenti TaxID=3064264 RepID=A0ABU1BPE8_9BURK|nr:Cache 3/Cache 2 fusion domain-containing protein [Oxalobacteraceae bacterium R-40]
MKKLMQKLNRLSLGAKLSLIMFLLVSAIFGIYAAALGYSTSSLLEKRAIKELEVEGKTVIDMVDMFQKRLNEEAEHSAKMLASYFPEKFSVDESSMVTVGERSVPTLKNGENVLNLQYEVLDRFTERSGATATLFVKTGSDFVRVTTSVKKETGERAVGTMLDHAHPGYALLMSGKSYNGTALLFGKKYHTEYDPIKDESGKVIGVMYVGINIDGGMKMMREKITAMKVGDTGGFFVLDANEGKNYGNLVMAAKGEGENILEQKAADGSEYIKTILTKKEGDLRYPFSADGKSGEKIAVFNHLPTWNWVVVGGTYLEEITHEATTLRNMFAGAGTIAVLILAALIYVIMRRSVTAPLAAATVAAQQLASGDLTTRVHTDREDEIGRLLYAMNGISQGLANVVWQVRNGTETIAIASSEIAKGNLDLSSRTEEQASSLEETAASMEELTSTVKQNADNARQANQLAQSASDVAVKGGEVVSQVVHTMEDINESAKKIVDIISVIDGIAFQTNILALNAAVEAARAGEQGRGFAVVASEVRSLAQRSAAAAKEIKSLISDSVEKVGAGTKLVDHAGTTMTEVVSSVRRVTDIMAEITAASQEQSSGIEQVNQAIAQMDQVTQQNAALVEQAAAAAESLQGQANSLAQLVGVFKMKSTSHGTSEEATEMVGNAIAYLKMHGQDKMFTEVNNKLGRFCDRDLYVVVYDINGRNLAHGANSKNIGQNLIDATDGDGKPFMRERISIMQKQSKAWQDYKYVNPITKQMEAKSMYIERVGDLIVGCGIYKT